MRSTGSCTARGSGCLALLSGSTGSANDARYAVHHGGRHACRVGRSVTLHASPPVDGMVGGNTERTFVGRETPSGQHHQERQQLCEKAARRIGMELSASGARESRDSAPPRRDSQTYRGSVLGRSGAPVSTLSDARGTRQAEEHCRGRGCPRTERVYLGHWPACHVTCVATAAACGLSRPARVSTSIKEFLEGGVARQTSNPRHGYATDPIRFASLDSGRLIGRTSVMRQPTRGYQRDPPSRRTAAPPSGNSNDISLGKPENRSRLTAGVISAVYSPPHMTGKRAFCWRHRIEKEDNASSTACIDEAAGRCCVGPERRKRPFLCRLTSAGLPIAAVNDRILRQFAAQNVGDKPLG